MKKIPSVFVRDFKDEHTALAMNEVTPGCEWVLAGEGDATLKWDGTAAMVRDGKLYARFDAKGGKTPPPGFEPAQEPDSVTEHWPGWVPTYGPQFKWIREWFSAHVASWLLHRGDVPVGKFVLHRCDVRPCVRPKHLFLGTHQDNMEDMRKKGRARKGGLFGEKHPMAILTEKQVCIIVGIVKKKGRRYGLQTRLAKRFGVTNTAIANILNGLTWRHLSGGRVDR